ncbi:MAG: methyl-accepting chemotaxis protein, partial [Desulforhabdus sp.]|nr:methyl-accepting chemotaxis protein [Desulforhabdus sp.]
IALLAAIVILLLVRSTVNPINRVIAGLGEAAEQVASGANEVASSSQQLAEGSSQQAAALEESSSSLEQMTSMTRQNASNAGHANSLMKEAIQVVSKANGSMQQLTTSMQEISQASEETSKIIKTIDEIAFQTNLLALNAAVEAARAGEAGAGFAVVADEVRNLAMRAADAARNTASLIEGTVKKVHEGGQVVARTNEEFSAVAKTSGKVDELVSEIAAASNEQAQGIEQVNRAVAEMDKVTQQTAAIAEESSGASEEMSSQAGRMKKFVEQLIYIVGGNGNHVNGEESSARQSAEAGREQILAARMPAQKAGQRRLPLTEQKMRPEQVIPMDQDAPLEDF